MNYWQMMTMGMQLATKVMVVVNKNKGIPKKKAINLVIRKLNRVLDHMIIE